MSAGTLVVATQLPPEFQSAIAARFAHVRFVAVPAGIPAELPPEASVLFAAPWRNGAAETPPRAEWIERIRWIQLLSSGTDSYPPWYFDAPCVSSARGPTAQPVAEFALAAIFAHSKQLPGVWIHDAADWRQRPLARVEDATLGIVGYGAIGRNLARMASALGMQVWVHRRNAVTPSEDGIHFCGLDELVARSDHLVLAAAATPETHHLICAATLRHARPHLHLVNVSRGTLVDQDALLAALDTGVLAAATLDVTDPEPLTPGHRLYTHPRVRLSPHVSSRDARLGGEIVELFCTNLQRFLAGDEPLNRVDGMRGY